MFPVAKQMFDFMHSACLPKRSTNLITTGHSYTFHH
uniref:Uncharacterized protein n=1 Tax=Arundo donax TaxID=35708 RepID=A0A0A9B5M1_ARUDO